MFDNSNTKINLKNSDHYLEHMKSYGSLNNGMLHSEIVVFKKYANFSLYLPVTAIKTLSRKKNLAYFYNIILLSFHACTNTVAAIWGSVKHRGRRIQDTIELERQGQMPY